MRILAIDVGTSGVKAGYWDGRRFVVRVQVAVATTFGEGTAEIAVRGLLKAVDEAARGAMEGREAPDVVAFDAFSSGVVVTDGAGKLVTNVITHQDRRSVLEAEEIVAEFGEEWLLKHVGNLPFPGGIGSSTLRWLQRNTRVLKGEAMVGQVSSLIGRYLTGRWVIDPSQACFLGLMDIRRGAWCEALCDFLGVTQSMLPRIEWADEVMGMTLAGVSRRWGLRSGTPVVGGFVDTSAAVLNTPMANGQLVHSSGTTDVLAMCVNEPRPAAHLLTRPVGVGRVLPERWLSVSTMAAAGSAAMWARETLFSEMTDGAFRQALARVCRREGRSKEQEARSKKTAGDVFCEPWFAGDRMSIAQKTASLAGLTLGTTREEILAGIVAGLVQERARGYGELAKVHRIERKVYTMGGATELAGAMHDAWPRKHTFVPIEADALAGLVKLARCAMNG